MTVAHRRRIHPASTAATTNVITIASGKGGVGKTWLAITLSHALARLGKRVLLFDGDLGLANVDVQLNLVGGRDIADVVLGAAHLPDAITQFVAGGFDIVAGCSGSGALAGMKQAAHDDLRQALLTLAKHYDHVIVDLGAGIDATMRSLTRGIGTTLVVATDEPTSLTDAYAYMKLSLRERPEADLQLVINMATDRRAGERTYAALQTACQNFLKKSPPLLGVIRRDPKVPEAIRHQTALLIRHPATTAAGDVAAIAEALC